MWDVFVEYLVECCCFDCLKILFILSVVDMFILGKVKFKLFCMYVVKVFYGIEYNVMVVDCWWYCGEDLYLVYDMW